MRIVRFTDVVSAGYSSAAGTWAAAGSDSCDWPNNLRKYDFRRMGPSQYCLQSISMPSTVTGAYGSSRCPSISAVLMSCSVL